jgi:hypothetical protein
MTGATPVGFTPVPALEGVKTFAADAGGLAAAGKTGGAAGAAGAAGATGALGISPPTFEFELAFEFPFPTFAGFSF